MTLWKGSDIFSSYYTLKLKSITHSTILGFHVKRGNCAATISRLPKCTKTAKQVGSCLSNPNHVGELCPPCQWLVLYVKNAEKKKQTGWQAKQASRQAGRQASKQNRQTNKQNVHTGRQRIQTSKRTSKQANSQAGRQADRQTVVRQRGRQTVRQADRPLSFFPLRPLFFSHSFFLNIQFQD